MVTNHIGIVYSGMGPDFRLDFNLYFIGYD